MTFSLSLLILKRACEGSGEEWLLLLLSCFVHTLRNWCIFVDLSHCFAEGENSPIFSVVAIVEVFSPHFRNELQRRKMNAP